MASKRQRTSFAKLQREKARMAKAAEKRARRLARKQQPDALDPTGEGTDPSPALPASPLDPPAE
ncbi:MAG TPA: hypothetical protein VF152_07105 [Acidimicrobiia bacterium]